ncbi:MAG: helix-turn-helix domain-containing protein [Clostridiales bacterium]|nr:helix-turn-helix domain-containing protein [Clostridiales bacterium]
MDIYEQIGKILKSESLEEVMKYTYGILRNPAFVVDMGHNVLAYTNVDVDSERWQRIVIEGKLAKNFVDGNIHLNAEHARAMHSDKALLLRKTFEGEDQIKKSLIWDGQELGMLMVLPYHKELEESDLKYVDLVGDIITYKLVSHQGMLYKNETQKKRFFSSMLEGVEYTEDTIQTRLKFMQVKFRKYLYVMVGSVGKNNYEGTVEEHIDLRELNSQNLGVALLYNTNLVMILSFDKPLRDYAEILNSMPDFLKRQNFVCGISSRFTNISDLRKNHLDAVRALQYGIRLRGDRPIYCFHDFILYEMFERVPDAELIHYIHPDIMKLRKYDEQKGTELCQTLQIYLDNNTSQAKTAEILYIHRNTVNYRLNQCMQIMETDFKERAELTVFLISLYILEYLDNK